MFNEKELAQTCLDRIASAAAGADLAPIFGNASPVVTEAVMTAAHYLGSQAVAREFENRPVLDSAHRVLAARLMLTRFDLQSTAPVWSSVLIDRMVSSLDRLEGFEYGELYAAMLFELGRKELSGVLISFIDEFLRRGVGRRVRLHPTITPERIQGPAAGYMAIWVMAQAALFPADTLTRAIVILDDPKVLGKVLASLRDELWIDPYREIVSRLLRAKPFGNALVHELDRNSPK